MSLIRGGFREGGGGVCLRNSFWPTEPKIFLKALWAPVYTNFEAERAPKNAIFLSTLSKKCPKTAFLTCFFFQKFACSAENLVYLRSKCFGRARKINLVGLKKGRQNFRKLFENPPSPPPPPPSRKS